MVDVIEHLPCKVIFIVTPWLEGWPTNDKETVTAYNKQSGFKSKYSTDKLYCIQGITS